jgi:DMSO reductase family type II enzyme molybdopterin subunit
MTSANDAGTTQDRYRQRQQFDRATFGTHCVNCFPNDCPVYVFAKDGKVVFEEAAAVLGTVERGVPDMNPMICQKGLAWSRQMDSPDRLLHPLRRAGERGEGRWERISWDEALGETADAILDAIEEIGPEAVVLEGTPEIAATIPAARFMSTLGGTVLDVDATINDFWAGFQAVFGKFTFASSIDDFFHSDVLLIWHANPAYTMIPAFHYMVEARYKGATIALISPDVSPSHSHVDYHVPVRHGTDGALALAMCQVVLAEGLADLRFASEQTDLSLLVRTDTGEYLRESNLRADGRADRFFQWHPEKGLVPADPASLRLDFEPQLAGTLEVRLASGDRAVVEPLLARVRRELDAHYTPEAAARVCEAHPDTIRMLARMVARGRTHIVLGAGVAKYFHGDLMTRGMLLLLGLTANWGRKGAGVGGWCSSMFDGHGIALSKTKPGRAGAREIYDGSRAMSAALCAQDPTLTPELADRAFWRLVGPTRGMMPPAFYWYWHAGFKERWNRPEWNDPAMTRSFDDYWKEALESGAWNQSASPSPEKPPRVLLEIGGNTLRRTRGGQGVLLEHLWPQLSKIVAMDYRMSETALHADIVLPATQHHEKVALNMPTPWTMLLTMSDAAVPPAGEARGEWEVLAELCKKLAERAAARGIENYRDRLGNVYALGELWSRFTLDGAFATDESAVSEMVADAVEVGNLPAGTTLETFRQQGYTRYAQWGLLALATAQASPFPEGETHAPLRDHVELGHPYPTLTRRAQFLIDHPWFRDGGEDLPAHKEAPAMGGDHPFLLSGGHARWSVHAMNMTNPVLLETHRGKPFMLINDRDAAARGIRDDAPVRVWNDVGEFVVPARTSPAQRPGALTIYNGFEGFMFPGGKGHNEVEPGLVKWLHLVGNYGHLSYTPMEWQPVPFDRCIPVDIEPIKEKS